MPAPKWVFPIAAAAALLACGHAEAQSFRQAGTVFAAMRPVTIPQGRSYSIVVTEFLHHGQIADDRRNVIVSARRRGPVPTRVLQLGPGDFCRLAFQPVPGQSGYEVFYGGGPPTEELPPWTCRDGLMLETRKYKQCNLNSLESVRQAFDSSTPIGADYVEGVRHARNPFSLAMEPFLSRYSGYLRIGSAGTYGFMTSSQDCSFLLIDGNPVVSAPGRHGRTSRAVPGSRKDVQLASGAHRFEYYHAAAGPRAVMVAAWEVSPTDEKPQPAAIPGESFHTTAVGRLPAGPVTLESGRPMPDFTISLAGDVPLPGNDVPLIGVLFRDSSPANLTISAKPHWDFGDGQTADKLNVDHVYLRPGVYTVKLSIKRGSRTIEVANRVNVDRPAVTRKDLPRLEKEHTLDNYLSILDDYNPPALDAASLRQLVLAYLAKADALQAEAHRPNGPAPPADMLAAVLENVVKAVEAGKAAFVAGSAARDDADLHGLAGLVGPLARDRLGDSSAAFAIWQGAAEKIEAGRLKAECQVEAADVAINDLLRADAGRKLLQEAARQLGDAKTGPAVRTFHSVRGDYYASIGRGEPARAAYRRAEAVPGSRRTYIERTAWRGAHGRSSEEFIRRRQYERAAAEIRTWQREFPTEKIDGYLTLTYARYWSGRGLYDRAIAQAEQLQAVNADSPYVDQILFLASECQMRLGKADRALAVLEGLVNDYPGSPLVPEVKKIIARLQARGTTAPKKPGANKP